MKKTAANYIYISFFDYGANIKSMTPYVWLVRPTLKTTPIWWECNRRRWEQTDDSNFKVVFSEPLLPHNLQFMVVGIGSATYDQIEYDLAFTMEGALGLVGGTMGLFLGFSSLSGVEIAYYLAKYRVIQVTVFF